jgi:DNA invertase Pin-like site-specific DNA recombinase
MVRFRMDQKRVALYARVSTRDKGQEPQNQLGELRDFCSRQGWLVVRQFLDCASGKNGNRPEFQKMLAAADRREFDLVLFWSLDRLSREGVVATLNYLERLTAAGVGWRSFTEQYLDSCGMFKDAVLAILAVMAKQERIRLSERTLAGLETARRAGRIGGRPRAVFSREELNRLRSEGHSLSYIAHALGISKTAAARAVKESA